MTSPFIATHEELRQLVLRRASEIAQLMRENRDLLTGIRGAIAVLSQNKAYNADIAAALRMLKGSIKE